MENVLLEMGFNPSYSGFHYTVWIMENCSIAELRNLMRVYVKTSKAFETTPRAIERSIRNFREKGTVYNKVTNKHFLNLLKIKYKELKKLKMI